jgi:hypothetical protein
LAFPPPAELRRTAQDPVRSLTLKTKFVCIGILLVGMLLHVVYGYFAFHPNSSVTTVLRRVFLGYIVAVPIILAVLRGDRGWRWTVFGVWIAYVGLIAFVIYTMD